MLLKRSLYSLNQFRLSFNRRLSTTPPKKRHLGAPEYSLPYGFAKVVTVLFFSIYLGSSLAKTAATALEENEIFVHSEDEDDE